MFTNTGGVLKWAYTTEAEPICRISSVHRMRQAPSRGAPNLLLLGLSVQERHIQAAEILGMVARLSDPAAAAYIGAKFGHRIDEKQLRALVYCCCDALGLPLTANHSVYLLLKAYFRGKVPYRAVRKVLGCRDQYALLMRSAMYETLDLIHDRAMADLQEDFEEHGLIAGGVEKRRGVSPPVTSF